MAMRLQRGGRPRWLIPAVALCVILLSVGVGLGRGSIRKLEQAQQWVGHSKDVLRAIERVRGRVDAAHVSHTATRTTADPGFLARHDSLFREAFGSLGEVQQLTRDNAVQQRRLDSLHVALDDLVVSSHRLADMQHASPRSPVVRDEGTRIEARFADIAAVVERLEREEENLLAARTAVASAAAHWAHAIVIVSTVFAAIIAAIALFPLYRALRQSRRAQAELSESEARYRQLVDEAADAILVSSNGRCASANAEAERLFHTSREALVGRVMSELLRPVRGGSTTITGSWSTHEMRSEFNAVSEDGSLVPVEVSGISFGNGMSQFIIRDITSRKAVERMKDEFLSVVSHELRTPLTSLRGSVKLLEQTGDRMTPEQRTRMLAIAGGNADRLVRLVNDILDLERLTAGRMTIERVETDVCEIVREAVENIRPLAQQAQVASEVNGRPAIACVDHLRIAQVVTNLLANAVKFSPANSTITVDLATEEGCFHLAVRDQGRGIPADQLESIFERFHQVEKSDARQKGGTGLGLAISRQIVRLHGGRIWAESNGTGSTFHVRIPIDGREDAAAGGAEPGVEVLGKVDRERGVSA